MNEEQVQLIAAQLARIADALEELERAQSATYLALTNDEGEPLLEEIRNELTVLEQLA